MTVKYEQRAQRIGLERLSNFSYERDIVGDCGLMFKEPYRLVETGADCSIYREREAVTAVALFTGKLTGGPRLIRNDLIEKATLINIAYFALSYECLGEK